MYRLRAVSPEPYSVSGVCRLLGKTKQAYYKSHSQVTYDKYAHASIALDYVHSIRSKDAGIGGVKLWRMYQRDFGESHPMGRDSFMTLLSSHGLTLRQKRRRVRTTDSRHGLPTYPNLIKDYVPQAANQLWVADITYIPIVVNAYIQTFCYVSFIMDAYTKEIIGWRVAPTLEACYAIDALQMALERIADKDINDIELIHHSDRGVQYVSSGYVRILQERGIRISMTETGDPKDNAQAERLNNTVKNELLRGMTFHRLQEVEDTLELVIRFYNQERPHMSLNYLTPMEASDYEGVIRKCWYSYREAAIGKSIGQETAIEQEATIANERVSCANEKNVVSLPMFSQGARSGLRPPLTP